MKKQELILKIPCGYKILEKQRQVDLVEAKKLFDIKHSYSKIQRKNDLVTVFWHRLVCPHCGKQQSPYIKNKQKIKTDEILYTPLFERENKTINLENAEMFENEYVCLKCGNVSYPSNQEQEIIIGHNQTSAYVMRKLRDINDYMNLNWIDCVDVATELYEKVEFNFKTGMATISIQTEQGAVVTKNITDFDLASDFSILAELINKNNVVKRTLKRQFQTFWEAKIPFTQRELSLKEFVMMTQFIDFSKEFYLSIPFSKQTNKIHDSFVAIATRLHTAKSAIEWLNKYSFAQKKSIKSLFYNKQGLFFYIYECEKLFNVLQNVDYFCQVMNSKSCFNILSVINNYSGIITFYEDYCYVVGVKKLVSALLCDLELLNENAVRYFAASRVGKMIEQENWKLEKNIEKEVGPLRLSLKTPFSIPMQTIPENINDCIVDRFQFKWLRTKSDYQKAGEQLDNCLAFWQYDSNPVVGVYIQGKIVAAIEVLGNRIYQARRFNNEIIDERSALFKAIQKWSKIYSLEFKEDYFDFE